jgi:hypothetical protein
MDWLLKLSSQWVYIDAFAEEPSCVDVGVFPFTTVHER